NPSLTPNLLFVDPNLLFALSKPPLLLNAFHAHDDRDPVADRALLKVHAEIPSLDREARFASAAHFAKHALLFATFLELDGQRFGHATYREITRHFERFS